MKKKKHLSNIANDLLQRCAETLDTTADALVQEFELGLKPPLIVDDYSRKLVEFCSSKALEKLCGVIGGKISDGSFSLFTFDMMLAWECPSSTHEYMLSENIAKEKGDRKEQQKAVGEHIQDEIPLFYSDILPLLVDEDKHVGEDAFVCLASLLPLAADVVNARFTFEALTVSTASRLHFPAYDKFLKEIDNCIKNLQQQASPTGFQLAEDEFILHVEGTATTQRVIRHIGGTSWPGRLTLTNVALYFEASGVLSYQKALKIDLSNPNLDHQVKAASTGPWGAPLFDKAIIYESSELSEPVVLEFPEMTSSTRRDLWLALVKEVALVHRFIFSLGIDSPLQAWEMQARTILGIFRLHAAREMLRMSPPAPQSFLIFSLFDELPKGDYVLEELRHSLRRLDAIRQCSAASILKQLDMSHPIVSSLGMKEGAGEQASNQAHSLASLDMTVSQVKEDAKEVAIAKSTAEGLKEEGITDSLVVLAELLSPLKDVSHWFQEILTCRRPAITIPVLAALQVIIYREWAGFAMAAILMCLVGMMLWARDRRIVDQRSEIVVSTSSDKTTVESIVDAQRSLKSAYEMMKTANISILKVRSILESRAPKHAEQVMLVMIGAAIALLAIPFRFILMGTTLACFVASSKAAKSLASPQRNRRLREWWDSIPVVPVRIVPNPL